MSAAEAVRGRGLTKRYGGVAAVDGVDLTLPPGQVRGLLGPNGAGKSTVLGMVLGLVEPDAGQLHVLGRDRAHTERGWLDGVAGVVGSPQHYPYLSGRRNLEHLLRLDNGPARSRVGEVLAQVGLADAAEQKVRGYSLGMRQRLGLAAALLRSPRLLVLDEPANGLDPAGARDLWALLRTLAAEGTAVLLSSHDTLAVEDVCDAVTVLRSGRTVFDGTLAQMRAAAPVPSFRLRTSDDVAALRVGAAQVEPTDDGLLVHAARDELDTLVLALGRAGIAVRHLSAASSPLQSLFFALTEAPGATEAPEQPAPAAAA